MKSCALSGYLLALLVAFAWVQPALSQSTLVAVTLKNTAVDGSGQPVAQSDIPVTFGQVFVKGALPTGNSVRGRILETGQNVPLQINPKATHTDGSLRHAVVNTVLPTLTAGQMATLELFAAPQSSLPSGITPSALLASGYSATVSLTLAGTPYSVSAGNLLTAPAFLTNPSAHTWLQGDQAMEWDVDGPFVDASNQPHPHLAAHFNIRAYTKLGQITNVRTTVIVENNWTYVPAPSNFTYDVSVSINGSVRYSKANLLHYHHARWRQDFWTGATPSFDLRHDAQYLIASGAVPNYDPTLIGNVDQAFIQSRYGNFSAVPMGLGLATQYMPTTGAHDDIGLLPRWSSLYVLGQDPLAKKATVGMGDLSGSWSIHYRDEITGFPVSIDTYPYICATCRATDTRNPATGLQEITPACTTCSTPFGHDTAHQPTFAYLPYLVTGDQYYLEELHFWANYNMMDAHPAYRQHSMGLVKFQQDRGQAWSMRTLGHAAYITPDTHPMKAYFTSKLANNLAYYTSRYVVTPPNGYGALAPGGYPAASPWQDDFFTAAVGVLVELDFPAAVPVRDWKAKFPVQRMGFGTLSPSDYCWNFAASYRLLIALNSSAPMFGTIKEVYDNSNGQPIPSGSSFNDHGLACESAALATRVGLSGPNDMLGYSDSPTGFPSNLQPALAIAKDSQIPGADYAWARFNNRLIKPNYRAFPNFAIVPRDSTPLSDHQAPTVALGVTATPLASSMVDVHWSASTDNVAVWGYNVYRDGAKILVTNALTFTDTNLAPSTTYRYQIEAFDASGNRAALSAAALATTSGVVDNIFANGFE